MEFLVTDCVFTAYHSDPCILFLRENGHLKIVMSIHVDDSLCSRSRENLDGLYENVRKRYKISSLGQITKYLGVRYEWKFDENGELYVAASMEKNATEIIKYYEKITGESAKVYKAPGWQNSVLNKNEKETIMLEEYRSLVGKLLYYTVNVGPDCANVARDLARHMANPGEEQWKAMRRVVGYLKGKNFHGHIMRRPIDLRAVQYCDASYTTDPISRISISGMVGTLGGMIVSWISLI